MIREYYSAVVGSMRVLTLLMATPAPVQDLLVIPGAGHNNVYGAAPQLYEAKALEFLGQNVSQQAVLQRACHPDEDCPWTTGRRSGSDPL